MVVLDIMMPEMEGTQVAQNMRKCSDYTPVLLTAKGGNGGPDRGSEYGADDYLAKPLCYGKW